MKSLVFIMPHIPPLIMCRAVLCAVPCYVPCRAKRSKRILAKFYVMIITHQQQKGASKVKGHLCVDCRLGRLLLVFFSQDFPFLISPPTISRQNPMCVRKQFT
mmetsp:Transcript_33978/g.47345  ORF Transcript_33978/g.47345 Transcript_33978/m.47345 type:complete len:103 (-) Transcript_33978:985-1293(-)